ncbi:DNA-packaging protein [Oceanicaulis sp. MMSF_3324]|uniref:DNA-packaging protein n=1 Tax=Oceanicaulis sp. MMSF_3324 TaxID=3046702 RepID=UPI0027401E77|nr:terminase family protein [Oceanicaulis sp. MMSF_3324]
MKALSESEAQHLSDSWAFWARDEQTPPKGDWRIWLFLGGRGAGKTRAGAEWVRAQVKAGCRRIALVAPTFSDVREVMVSGPSGFLNIGDEDDRPRYEASRHRLIWPNGAEAHGFSSEDPDGLRGPQFDCAWADEFAAWTRPQETLDMLGLGLRLGEDPRLMITTTPRPLPALKALLTQSGVVMTHATTQANAAHLAPGFVAAMTERYGASRLARQELDGVLIDDPEGALWTRSLIDQALGLPAFEPERVVVAVDPPASASGDECGIIATGCSGQGREAQLVVLKDMSLQGRPEVWAAKVAEAFEAVDADWVVAEANQGGDMVRAVLQAAAPDLPIRLVHASRGKRARAEPVAALYAKGRVRHAGRFPALEDQMCAFGASELSGSPDRVDALVWAIAALTPQAASPRLRRL